MVQSVCTPRPIFVHERKQTVLPGSFPPQSCCFRQKERWSGSGTGSGQERPRTPCGRANGQTPPTACPVICRARSCGSILALNPKVDLNSLLSILVSPAVTIRRHPSPSAEKKERVLAMRASSTPTATAASSTVALETENSRCAHPDEMVLNTHGQLVQTWKTPLKTTQSQEFSCDLLRLVL